MPSNTRENRGLRVQVDLILATFRRESPARAVALLWPVACRRLKEIVLGWLTPLQVLTPRYRALRRFIVEHLPETPDLAPPRKMGNYLAYTDGLGANTVVYSFGVGGDVSFDMAMADATGCVVDLFDPTPRFIRFMERYKDDARLRFHPIGIWTQDGPIPFFSDVTLIVAPDGSTVQEYRSGSITNITGSAQAFEAECLTLASIMARLGHDHVDVLKMDIEGAAIDVLEHILTTSQRPGQIVVEFEAPKVMKEMRAYLARIERLARQLRAEGYTLQLINRGALHMDSLEILAARMPAARS